MQEIHSLIFYWAWSGHWKATSKSFLHVYYVRESSLILWLFHSCSIIAWGLESKSPVWMKCESKGFYKQEIDEYATTTLTNRKSMSSNLQWWWLHNCNSHTQDPLIKCWLADRSIAQCHEAGSPNGKRYHLYLWFVSLFCGDFLSLTGFAWFIPLFSFTHGICVFF